MKHPWLHFLMLRSRAAHAVTLLVLAASSLAGCAQGLVETPGAPGAVITRSSSPFPTEISPSTPESAAMLTPTRTFTSTPAGMLEDRSSVPTPTFDPQEWQNLPVIPGIGSRAVEILKAGLARGNNPHAFSKVGDCESQASWFLENFDLGSKYYTLGRYQAELEPVVAFYTGSFKRNSLSARPGFSAASLMAPIWADRQKCEKNETPLACEYRVHRPLVAFIMVGSNDASNPKTFEGHMRKVIEYTIAQGILPVLGTKADNVEGDHFVNATIARLAYEYGVPLWNFWSAVQDLPDHGLQEDGVHLTYGQPHFDDAYAMQHAWPVRNLNALQMLEKVMEYSQN